MSIFKVFKLIFTKAAKAAGAGTGRAVLRLRKLLRNFLAPAPPTNKRTRPPRCTDFLEEVFGREYLPGDLYIYMLALRESERRKAASHSAKAVRPEKPMIYNL